MNYKKITVETLSKFAIGLFVIIAIAVFIGTFQNNTFKTVSELKASISELKNQLESKDGLIAQAEAEIAKYEEELPALKNTEADAKKKSDEANAALDVVCDRSYYSPYFCVDPSACEPLHEAVSETATEYKNAKSAVSSCEQAISRSRSALLDATEQKEELNVEIKHLSSLKAKASWSAFFLVVAMLLTLAGLVFFSMFLLNRVNKKNGLIACGMLALASFLYMILPTYTIFLTYLSGIVVFAIFAALISEKIQKRITARVFAIIFSVIIFAATLLAAPVTAFCAAVAFILVSLILVPCVYTEYLDIAKHIFFTIITLGIWLLIWMYNTTENLNKVEQAEKRAPIRELLLCAFLPLYYIFWIYKTAGNTELYANEKGKSFKIDILCFVLSVISPLLASVIVQDKTNIIVGKPVPENAVEDVPVEEAPIEEAPIEEAPIEETSEKAAVEE